MTSSLSETPAIVNDTIAGVTIFEQDTIMTDTTGMDSVVKALSDIEINAKDIYDSVWSDCYNNTASEIFTNDSDTSATEKNILLEETFGVSGIPQATDTTRNDIVSSVVLICFFITMTIFAVSRNYISRQTKKFFGKISKSRSFSAETINEVKLNIYFIFQSCVIFSILTYIIATSFEYVPNSKIPLILIIPASTILYLLYIGIKYILYYMVDDVFNDDSKIKREHSEDFSYITTIQGMLLFPLLLLSISSGIETSFIVIYTVIVIVFAKLLAFYKTLCTFSVHYKTILQIILYFCALEMIPLMSLCGILVMIAKYL